MKRTAVLALALAFVVLLAITGTILRTYNRLVTLDESVDAQWAQVENTYQRRADLVPNLVATVRGAAAHERETLQAVTEARARVARLEIGDLQEDPEALARFEAAQSGLSSALTRLLAVSESYPQLRANENFLALQSQLEGTENRISVERMRYNEAAREFNTKLETFPTAAIAEMFGDRFETKAYFEAQPGATQVPTVDFEAVE